MPAAAADTAPNRRRNPNPNLTTALRCGARTRSGCACKAPAIRGKLRCRMHGGRSTGARTPEGLNRLRAARTDRSGDPATARALHRHILTLTRRTRIFERAVHHLDRLPPDLAQRLLADPPELAPPPFPVTGLTADEDRLMLRAEREALGVWKDGLNTAKPARRATRVAPPHAPAPTPAQAVQKAEAPHAPAAAPVQAAQQAETPHATEPAPAAAPQTAARPHPPRPPGSTRPTQAAASRTASPPLSRTESRREAGSGNPAKARPVQTPHAPGRVGQSAATPHAPDPIRIRPATTRQVLMAGTQHGTLSMIIEAGGGWGAFAGFVGNRIKDCPDLGSLLRGGR